MTEIIRFENPFAMGNLDDLMTARLNNDLEYLKEWSKRAVETHEKDIHIQLKAFEKLIEIKNESSISVEEIRQMLKETHNFTPLQRSDETEVKTDG